MGTGSGLHCLGVRSDLLVRRVDLSEGHLSLLEQPGVLERDRCVGGEGGQQRDLGRRKRTHGPVPGQEGTDDPALHHERHAEDRADVLVRDGVVD